jgi:hypothetical protein
MKEIADKFGWTCTDPDNKQFGRKLSPGVYEFKEWIGGDTMKKSLIEQIEEDWNRPGSWEQKTITVADYTPEEIQSHISGYYKDVNEVKEIYGDFWEWIVAECIFEQISCLY